MIIFNVCCLIYPFIIKVEQAENMNIEQVNLNKITEYCVSAFVIA